MSLADDELLIRKYQGESMITPVMPSGGRVIPAPIFFENKEDYWATNEAVSAPTTQLDAETRHIVFCCYNFKNFVDISGKPDSPLVGLVYELYVFSQYDLVRTDENVSPDSFNKKMLEKHNEFVKLALDLKEQYQGQRSMGLFSDAVYAIQRTTSLVMTEFVENKAQCIYIPGVNGHAAKFQETVQMQLVAC